MSTNKIIVGYDGSPDARRAARWALDEAERTGAAVEFCHAATWPAYLPLVGMAPPRAVQPGADSDLAVVNMVHAMAESAAQSHPGVTVTSVIKRGPAVATLAQRSGDAGLLVLGSRGHSALAGAVGSVSDAVSAQARCPLVVVRGGVATGAPVVAGVDDPDSADLILGFAFEQAAGRGVALRVIRCWLPPALDWGGSAEVVDAISAAEQARVAELTNPWREKYPDVPVTTEVPVGDAGRVLTEAGLDAQLIVVGSHGRGPLWGTLLGSVSHHLLHHATCSVAIVRKSDDGDLL